MDFYPTLSELAGLTLPTGAGGAHLGGTSLVPVFHAPATATVKAVALSQFPRCWQNNTGFDMNQILGPGDEVRTYFRPIHFHQHDSPCVPTRAHCMVHVNLMGR